MNKFDGTCMWCVFNKSLITCDCCVITNRRIYDYRTCDCSAERIEALQAQFLVETEEEDQ